VIGEQIISAMNETLLILSVLHFSRFQQEETDEQALQHGAGSRYHQPLTPQQTGKRNAHRQVKALLHTFAAGQKYGVWRDATRRL
jgi:hypothetical protein